MLLRFFSCVFNPDFRNKSKNFLELPSKIGSSSESISIFKLLIDKAKHAARKCSTVIIVLYCGTTRSTYKEGGYCI